MICFLMALGPAGNWLPIYGMSNVAHFSIQVKKTPAGIFIDQ